MATKLEGKGLGLSGRATKTYRFFAASLNLIIFFVILYLSNTPSLLLFPLFISLSLIHWIYLHCLGCLDGNDTQCHRPDHRVVALRALLLSGKVCRGQIDRSEVIYTVSGSDPSERSDPDPSSQKIGWWTW